MVRDIFISYNSHDRKFAERLAQDLTTYGVRVWWDQWEMGVGDSLIKKIQEGIAESSWLAVVLSPTSVSSAWVERELAAAMVSEIESRRVVVLPLLLDDCQIPPFLKDKIYADFRDSYESGLRALLTRVAPPIDPKIARDLLSERESRVLRAHSKIPAESRHRYQQFLHTKLASPRSRDRLGALSALSILRDPKLGQQLRAMLDDRSSAIRARIAFHLGRQRRRDAIPAIETLMQDDNPAVRSAARRAYKEITGSRP